MVKINGIENLSAFQQNMISKKADLESQNNVALSSLALKTRLEATADSSKPPDEIDKLKDELLPNDIKTKFRLKVVQASQLPEYAIRGLKGDPDANFFEFLQLAKVPYYVGGPILAWCFAAGGKAAKPVFRQKATGVALYYLAAVLASKAVNTPIRLLRGVDLDQNYRKITRLRTQTPDGLSPMRREYHKVYESVDFTYHDLLKAGEVTSANKHRTVNRNFDKVAKKMGIKEDLNDSDTAVKPVIRKLIIMSRAWQYALTLPFTAVAIGISAQDHWKGLGERLVHDLKNKKPDSLTMKNIINSAKGIGNTLKMQILPPLKSSIKDFWKGTGTTGISKVFGKAAIIGSIAGVLYANLAILRATSLKDKEAVDLKVFSNFFKNKTKNIAKSTMSAVGISND